MKYTYCDFCERDISNHAYARHRPVCKGKKDYTCPHCKQSAAELRIEEKKFFYHRKWCKQNPDRAKYIQHENIKAMQKAKILSGKTNSFTKARIEGRVYVQSAESIAKSARAALGRKHSDETKKFLSEAMKQRIRENGPPPTKRTVYHTLPNGETVRFDSGWEIALAAKLDKLGVRWEREHSLEWTDVNGGKHTFFPDFFLPEYDVYLEPKSRHVILKTQEKVDYIKKHYPNVYILDSFVKCRDFELEHIGLVKIENQ